MVRWPHSTSVPAVSTKPFSGWDRPQPSADQAPKFLQVFGKPPLSLQQTFAPFTPGELGLATSRELQRGRDPNVSLRGDLSHCCPSSALSPGRDHRSSLDQEVAFLPLRWLGLVRALVPSFSPPVPARRPASVEGAWPALGHSRLLPPFPGFHKPPYSACLPHPRLLPAQGDSPRVTLTWGQMSFLMTEVYQNPSRKSF